MALGYRDCIQHGVNTSALFPVTPHSEYVACFYQGFNRGLSDKPTSSWVALFARPISKSNKQPGCAGFSALVPFASVFFLLYGTLPVLRCLETSCLFPSLKPSHSFGLFGELKNLIYTQACTAHRNNSLCMQCLCLFTVSTDD